MVTCVLVDKYRCFGGIFCFFFRVETIRSSRLVFYSQKLLLLWTGRLEVNVWCALAKDEVVGPIFLDTFAQSRKAPFKLRHVRSSVFLSICIIAALTGRVSTNFDIEDLRKSVEKIQIWLNRAKKRALYMKN